MCSKNGKVFLILLVLVLVSAQLYSWSPRLVGPDSKSLTIHNQELMIDTQASQIVLLREEVKQKENEILLLQESLMMYQSESEGLLTDSEMLVTQVKELQKLLTIANEELTILKSSLNESEIELVASEVLVETATEIVAVEPPVESPFGMFLGAGATYDLADFGIKLEAGVSYGMFDLSIGVQTDIGSITSMIDPTNFTYETGLRVHL